ncbi:unnamed protein product [Cuscuta epithymum]|uniref:Uncharacterized protein n=1 Tax=Cuscuta epithymum TaxID=186058 RepID=A0AAV0F5G2_9ASTE|nr:unnamed protein product [Cuscuta epithymum]
MWSDPFELSAAVPIKSNNIQTPNKIQVSTQYDYSSKRAITRVQLLSIYFSLFPLHFFFTSYISLPFSLSYSPTYPTLNLLLSISLQMELSGTGEDPNSYHKAWHIHRI